jgi:hypothetical protein
MTSEGDSGWGGKVQGLTPRHITHTPLTSLQKYIQKFG